MRRGVRVLSQAVDRVGLTVTSNPLVKEVAMHRPVMALASDKQPLISAGTFIAPNASCLGKVLMYTGASVWYGAVLRGDQANIVIGGNTNIQDRVVINTVSKLETGFPADVEIGDRVTVGAGSIITSSTIGDKCMIGMGSVIQEGCVIQDKCYIAAGSVVAPGTYIEAGQFWAGNPAKYIRAISEDEEREIESSAEIYVELGEDHAAEFLPYGTLYQLAEKA